MPLVAHFFEPTDQTPEEMRCKGVPAYAQSASDGIWGNSQINAICLDFPGISANALGLVAATVSSLNRHLFLG